jgi:hypothetical protein
MTKLVEGSRVDDFIEVRPWHPIDEAGKAS